LHCFFSRPDPCIHGFDEASYPPTPSTGLLSFPSLIDIFSFLTPFFALSQSFFFLLGFPASFLPPLSRQPSLIHVWALAPSPFHPPGDPSFIPRASLGHLRFMSLAKRCCLPFFLHVRAFFLPQRQRYLSGPSVSAIVSTPFSPPFSLVDVLPLLFFPGGPLPSVLHSIPYALRVFIPLFTVQPIFFLTLPLECMPFFSVCLSPILSVVRSGHSSFLPLLFLCGRRIFFSYSDREPLV